MFGNIRFLSYEKSIINLPAHLDKKSLYEAASKLVFRCETFKSSPQR